MKKTPFESDKAFWKAFEQFNFLYGGMLFEWKPTTARKEHVDIFDVRIKPDETYFRKELGGYSYDSAENFPCPLWKSSYTSSLDSTKI